jgi:hypothetical protein
MTHSVSNQFAPPEGYMPAISLSNAVADATGLTASSLFSSASDFIGAMVDSLGPGIPSIGLSNAGLAGPISSVAGGIDPAAFAENDGSFQPELSSFPDPLHAKPEPLSFSGDYAGTMENGFMGGFSSSLPSVLEHEELSITKSPLLSSSSSESFDSSGVEVTAFSRNFSLGPDEVQEEEQSSLTGEDDVSTTKSPLRASSSASWVPSGAEATAFARNFSLGPHQDQAEEQSSLKGETAEEEDNDAVSTVNPFEIDAHFSSKSQTFPNFSDAAAEGGDSVKELIPKTSSALPSDFFEGPTDTI